eukprot:TRINITY_DN17636_c0_g1_i1.p1 TRINITY_DN17636_c0_g1~~TRINITY_DN17636_c0_g1_i1.p1  ORF type:complete len:349 (+),score=74.05 TRINITY_DN17636_c0_g1_i1:66-1112(+)
MPHDLPLSEITGTTVWDGRELEKNPDLWIHYLSLEEQKELEEALRHFQSLNLEPIKVRKENFPLPRFQVRLAEIRNHLINERGVFVFRGLDVHNYTREQQSVIFLGLGDYLGDRVSQNGKGHVLGHVKNLNPDLTQKNVRLYATNVAQRFHTDGCDVVALLCLRKSVNGGLSAVASSHKIFNEMLNTRPDLLEILFKPFNWERKGEVGPGETNVFQNSIMFQADGKLLLLYDRFWLVKPGCPDAPPPSDVQIEAIDYMEALAAKFALNMVLEEGDMQFVHNVHVMHARSGFEDHPTDATKQRHLLRLWLSLNPDDGGWVNPRWKTDSNGTRAGVRVAGVTNKVPLEAE